MSFYPRSRMSINISLKAHSAQSRPKFRPLFSLVDNPQHFAQIPINIIPLPNPKSIELVVEKIIM